MSLRWRALLATLPLVLGALALPHGGAAAPAPDPGALSHCAAIIAADERLACYDSLARPKPSPAAAANPAPASSKASPHSATAADVTSTAAAAASAAPAAVSAAPAAVSAAPAAVSAAQAAASAAPAAVSAAPAAAAAAAGTAAAGTPADPKSFGLTKHTAPSDEGPDHIRAKVTRIDTNRLGNVRLALDNGQAWTFDAPDALIHVGDPVTIKRGVLGSFLLTTPAHHTYKAQRSQ